MRIDKINIENFRCFYGKFSLELNEGVNVLVGDISKVITFMDSRS